MRVAVIGAGVVGLALSRQLLRSDKNIQVDIYDSFSIPSKGTSIRNSGVLHAGLYYNPGTLKSRLCFEGRNALEAYIDRKALPLFKCGKLLVPHTIKDIERLKEIKDKADKNGCETYIVDYDFASKVQPNICKRSDYLWSPKTAVFSPSSILHALVSDLIKSERVAFQKHTVYSVDPSSTCIASSLSTLEHYDFIFNVSGPGALKIFQQISNSLDHLRLIPFIGEYARLKLGPQIKTNIYPVPDPELPFLGVHVTPRAIGDAPIIGPNALPFPRSYLDEYLSSDMTQLPSRLSLLSAMFLGNRANLRSHAISEFSVSKKAKFMHQTLSFFDDSYAEDVEIQMDNSVYGIRPQLVDINKLDFVNDFLLERTGNIVHVVNAVSPAFTSALSFASYLTNMI